ncbi:MAG: alpha-L-rhamnosidase, partial [Bacteroidota bacterium]|nr:alpha-L-rhamnosidase [Bacteroidota bacterium]
DQLRKATYEQCFNKTKGEMANTPLQNSYSQHASILGVLTGAVPEADRKKVMEKVLHDGSLSQATFYYRFYLNRALKKAGMADSYYGQLTPWRGMIANGLTTFAENPDPTRSDCHAWSSSPNYDFLATICGILPSAPGFSAVRIEPAMGELTEVKGSMPHPDGMITVSLQKMGKEGVSAEIQLPPHLTGEFIWKGKKVALKSGIQHIRL